MDAKEWDKRLGRLLAVVERMASLHAAGPAPITVNVNVGGESESDPADEGEDAAEAGTPKRRAISSSTSNDVPKPGGMPRPWVS